MTKSLKTRIESQRDRHQSNPNEQWPMGANLYIKAKSPQDGEGTSPAAPGLSWPTALSLLPEWVLHQRNQGEGGRDSGCKLLGPIVMSFDRLDADVSIGGFGGLL